MVTKFDRIIEHIIGGNQNAARKLFHEVVVEKSRKIYENLEMEDMGSEDDQMVDEHGGLLDEVDVEETSGINEVGGDEADDFDTDVVDPEVEQPMAGAEDGEFTGDDEEMAGDDEFGNENEFGDEEEFGGEEGVEGEEEEVEDRFVDIEDALAELQAEFAKLAGESGEEEGEETEEEPEEESEEETEEEPEEEEEDDTEEELDEAVQLSAVSKPTNSESEGTNKKSAVAFNSGSKIIKGVDSKNLTQGTKGGEEKGRPAPATKELKADGSTEFKNRAGLKKNELKPVGKKPVTTKEVEGTGKKSVIESKKKVQPKGKR